MSSRKVLLIVTDGLLGDAEEAEYAVSYIYLLYIHCSLLICTMRALYCVFIGNIFMYLCVLGYMFNVV